jgi:hypothetical protein
MSATRVPKVSAAALLILVCALARAAPGSAGAAPETQGGEITPGKGVGPITLGMSLEDLVLLWGRPQQADRDQDGVDRYDYSEPRGVLVFLKEDRVAQLLVVTPAWSTPSGAKVGTPWPQVRAFLGLPEETLPGQTQDESRYWYRQRGIGFFLKGRTVSAIFVLPGMNEPGSRGVLEDLLGKGKGRGEGGR